MVAIKHEDKEAQAPSCSVCSVDADLPTPRWWSGIQFPLNLPALASSPPILPLASLRNRPRQHLEKQCWAALASERGLVESV